MSIKEECIGCRLVKDVDEFFVCADCRAWEKQHLEELNKETRMEHTCTQCGYEGAATDLHHIHGRKNSAETIRVCCNCHREVHTGTRELVL